MTFPKKLLLLLGLAVCAPTGLTLAHGHLLPDRAGQYQEREALIPVAQDQRTQRYAAPVDAGQLHDFNHAPYYGLGKDVPRRWFGHGPEIGAPRAAIVLLHGSNRDGRAMIDMWRGLADRHDLVLIAPNATTAQGWSLLQDGPDFMAALIEDAARSHPIDRNRIYLVGHSAGAIFAGRLANLPGAPWRGVATHAGSPTRYGVVPAARNVPIHAWVGDSDPLFPLERERATARHMAQAGHDVTLTVVRGHGHWYYDIAPQLAERMWAQLRG